jgi:hypothetical protein
VAVDHAGSAIGDVDVAAPPLLCPFGLSVDTIGSLLNCELSGHPVYDGLELQWFDDDVHGRGMLAFLSRREDRRVDYYVDPSLHLDRANYAIGGGTGAWVTTSFVASRLDVDDGGVVADVRFRDIDGRDIEVTVDDRDAGRRHLGDLLAPVGAGIDAPTSLMLVVLHGFDLVRRTATPAAVRIDGELVATGVLPGGVLHRRHLVKAAAPLSVARVCPEETGLIAPIDPAHPAGVRLSVDARHIDAVTAEVAGASAELRFDPPVPSLTDLDDGSALWGAWQVLVDGGVMTGGTWTLQREGHVVDAALDVTRRWRPAPGLPMLLRIVTRIVPTFRRWPTTYRWRAVVLLDGAASIVSRWERTGEDRGGAYRRATGS